MELEWSVEWPKIGPLVIKTKKKKNKKQNTLHHSTPTTHKRLYEPVKTKIRLPFFTLRISFSPQDSTGIVE